MRAIATMTKDTFKNYEYLSILKALVGAIGRCRDNERETYLQWLKKEHDKMPILIKNNND